MFVVTCCYCISNNNEKTHSLKGQAVITAFSIHAQFWENIFLSGVQFIIAFKKYSKQNYKPNVVRFAESLYQWF